MKRLKNKSMTVVLLALFLVIGLCSCVPQKKTVDESKEKDNIRLVATSLATAQICDKLELPLEGVCKTYGTLPDRYKDVTKVGLAMNPDLEVIKSLRPDYVLSPASLENDLKPKYEAAGLKYKFLDLSSVQGMYKSIDELGAEFNRTKQAKKLNDEFQQFMKEYKKGESGKKPPKALVLMGLPGSYIIATPKSYVGSLVELAGYENVFPHDEKEFLNVNTEELKQTEPDIILRAAHAMPEDVKKMFADEFNNNQIWKHFKAVEEGRVYDLDPNYFGMSANFSYQDALKQLKVYEK